MSNTLDNASITYTEKTSAKQHPFGRQICKHQF
jgi:hypothetical protein